MWACPKENTVKKSLLRIYDKLGVSNRVELVLYALSHSQERLPEEERLEQPGNAIITRCSASTAARESRT